MKCMMGIEESTCDKHQVLHESDESLNSKPETNITLYANWNLNKKLEGKNKQSPNNSTAPAIFLCVCCFGNKNNNNNIFFTQM